MDPETFQLFITRGGKDDKAHVVWMLRRLHDHACEAKSPKHALEKAKAFAHELLCADLECGTLGHLISDADRVKRYIKTADSLLDACDEEGAKAAPDILRIVRLAVEMLVIGGQAPRGAYGKFAALEATQDDSITGIWSGVRLGASITVDQLEVRLLTHARWLQCICSSRLGKQFARSVMLCAAVWYKCNMVVNVENIFTPEPVDKIAEAVDAMLAPVDDVKNPTGCYRVRRADADDVHLLEFWPTALPGWGAESYESAFKRWECTAKKAPPLMQGASTGGGLGGASSGKTPASGGLGGASSGKTPASGGLGGASIGKTPAPGGLGGASSGKTPASGGLGGASSGKTPAPGGLGGASSRKTPASGGLGGASTGGGLGDASSGREQKKRGASDEGDAGGAGGSAKKAKQAAPEAPASDSGKAPASGGGSPGGGLGDASSGKEQKKRGASDEGDAGGAGGSAKKAKQAAPEAPASDSGKAPAPAPPQVPRRDFTLSFDLTEKSKLASSNRFRQIVAETHKSFGNLRSGSKVIVTITKHKGDLDAMLAFCNVMSNLGNKNYDEARLVSLALPTGFMSQYRASSCMAHWKSIWLDMTDVQTVLIMQQPSTCLSPLDSSRFKWPMSSVGPVGNHVAAFAESYLLMVFVAKGLGMHDAPSGCLRLARDGSVVCTYAQSLCLKGNLLQSGPGLNNLNSERFFDLVSFSKAKKFWMAKGILDYCLANSAKVGALLESVITATVPLRTTNPPATDFLYSATSSVIGRIKQGSKVDIELLVQAVFGRPVYQQAWTGYIPPLPASAAGASGSGGAAAGASGSGGAAAGASGSGGAAAGAGNSVAGVEHDELPLAQRPTHLYHGTSLQAALNIQEQGFKTDRISHGSNLGRGVYASSSIAKANSYANDKTSVVLLLKVDLGRCATTTRMRTDWHPAFDSIYYRNSYADEFCIWDPKRVTVVDVIPTCGMDLMSAGYKVNGNGRLEKNL